MARVMIHAGLLKLEMGKPEARPEETIRECLEID
jgi:hypothetical protein